ncbi:MAG: hypothetical protein WBQ10_18290, partial [Terriglobales bacterium]
ALSQRTREGQGTRFLCVESMGPPVIAPSKTLSSPSQNPDDSINSAKVAVSPLVTTASADRTCCSSRQETPRA